MKKIYFIALVGTILLSSCANDKEEKDNSLVAPVPVQQNTKPDSSLLKTTAAPANNIVAAPGGTPVNINSQTATVSSQQAQQQIQQQIQQQMQQQMQQAQQTAQKTAPGMNPPHGQPGHRCDIAVGAPLNSAPSQPAATSATQPQVKMETQPVVQQAVTPTAPGMNPPHGQPNHRCDIAVGAPLNSKPATPAATATPAIVNPTVATPIKTDTLKQ